MTPSCRAASAESTVTGVMVARPSDVRILDIAHGAGIGASAAVGRERFDPTDS